MSISLVQQIGDGIVNATSGTTTLNKVAAGDLLTILAAGANNAYTISSITDNLGNTWSKAAQSNVNADVEVWYASNVKAGNTTVTIKYSTAQYASWNFAEWSGVSGTVDVKATNNGGTSPAKTGAINTTNANDLLVGLIGTESQNPGTFSDTGSSNGTPTGLDWDPNDDESGAAAYQIVSKTGNYEFSASTAPYDTWDAAIVAFKAATASAISVSGNVSQGFSLRNAQTLSLTGALVERVAALVSSIQKTAAALASGSSLGASAIPQSSSTLPTGAALTGGEFTSAASILSQTTETSIVAALQSFTGVANASVAAQGNALPQGNLTLPTGAALTSGGTSQMAGQGGLETQAYAQAISAMLAQISQSLSANASIEQVFALAGALLAGFEVATGVGTESTALTNVLTSLTQQVETSEAGTVNLGLSATATAELVFALAGVLAASFGTAAEVSANSTALANVLVSLTQQIETSGIATVNLYATSEEAIQTLLSSTLAMQTTIPGATQSQLLNSALTVQTAIPGAAQLPPFSSTLTAQTTIPGTAQSELLSALTAQTTIPGTAQSELNSTLTAQTTIPSTAQSELNSVLTAQTAASALSLAQAIAQLAVASSMNAVEVIAQSVLATLTLNTTIDMEFGLSLVALLEESGAISAVAAKVIRIALVLAASLTRAVVITAPLAQALVLSTPLSQTVVITAPLAQKLVLSSRLSPTLVIAGGL